MKRNKMLYLMMLLLGMGIMVACSENDGEVEEFADWQNKNETYFNQLYASTQQRIAKGDQSWKIIRKWSLPEDNQHFHANLGDYIIVHILNAGNSTSGSPLYTDSVKVNYRGRLIPSATYTGGYVFDRSYNGKYNPQTMRPATFAVNGLVDGFTTALMHMTIGDRWEVYIPHQLGYGNKEQSNGTIPAYSTLIFDIGLAGFYRAEAPTVRASASTGKWIER